MLQMEGRSVHDAKQEHALLQMGGRSVHDTKQEHALHVADG